MPDGTGFLFDFWRWWLIVVLGYYSTMVGLLLCPLTLNVACCRQALKFMAVRGRHFAVNV